MVIKAKFRCDSVMKFVNGETVELHPVVSGSDENKEWSKYTPTGTVSMTITTEGAVNSFVPGKEYYLEFTEA